MKQKNTYRKPFFTSCTLLAKKTRMSRGFQNVSFFDSESVCVKTKSFGDTDTTKWMGKRFSISVSVSSNLVEQPKILCNADLPQLPAFSMAALKRFLFHNNFQLRTIFLVIKTAPKMKRGGILVGFSQRHKRRY